MARVLIVEDEPLVARMYQKALKFEGFETEFAIGGKEGFEKSKSWKPDLILLDIMMPEPNGMQVLEQLQKEPSTKNIPIVMLTNLSGKRDAELALQKGARDYWVKKDTEVKLLGKKIREIIGEKAEKEQAAS